MKRFILCIALLLCLTMLGGCSVFRAKEAPIKVDPTATFVQVGNTLTVENTDPRLTLLDNKNALAAEGLYYATWGSGNCEDYENSEGDIIDLYDAQVYLLLGEAKNNESAQESTNTWLAAAEGNYKIEKKETLTCAGNEYTVLTYTYKGEDTPFERGISAFGTFGTSSVCVEFTCRSGYKEDPTDVMTTFLNHCSYQNN